MTGTHGPHLRRRSGIFHFRMKVPDALQLRVGTVEIWRSLRTYSPIEARHLAANYAVRLMEAFAVMTNKGFAKEECISLLSTVFRGLTASVDNGIKLDAINPDVDIFLWYGVMGVTRDDGEAAYIYNVNYDVRRLKILIGRADPSANRIAINPAFWSGLEIAVS